MHLLENVNGRRKISYGAEYFACKFAMNLLYNRSGEKDVNCIEQEISVHSLTSKRFQPYGIIGLY
jgi:hypothetical protein